MYAYDLTVEAIKGLRLDSKKPAKEETEMEVNELP